jgi:hypothetical protein
MERGDALESIAAGAVWQGVRGARGGEIGVRRPDPAPKEGNSAKFLEPLPAPSPVGQRKSLVRRDRAALGIASPLDHFGPHDLVAAVSPGELAPGFEMSGMGREGLEGLEALPLVVDAPPADI